MRIAIFTETYLPQINGVVTHIKILKEGLEALGHTVLIVTADSKARTHYLKDNVLHCPAHNLKRIYNLDLASPVSRTRLKYLREFRPDIIHVHNEFSIGLSGMAIAKILKVPLVYTLHTMYDDYIYYIAPKPLIPLTKKLSHRYFRMFPQNAAVVTGPSKKCQEYTYEIGSDKKVEVIPNPVELDAFAPQTSTPQQRAQIREQYRIPQDATVACFVGRLGREKSVDVLLRFWAQEMKPQDNMRLLIIGDGPEKEPLEQLAQQLGITDTVIFTGKVLHPDLPPYIHTCDIYVTASLSDTNSISMLEGMAGGLPVLQLYDELNADQVTDGVNGYMFRDAAEMGQRLRQIRDMEPEELQKLKTSVIQSVKNSGAQTLANYIQTIYYNIYQKQPPKKPPLFHLPSSLTALARHK
ncbi:MAG: glycosyltransferase [Negativibacillus sp.]|nr:glycosyltransferase [Negativibacillus sp.]